MRKSIAVLLAAFAALPATRLMGTVIPPIGLAPGSEYQLIFVTAGATYAWPTDISFYNSFVNSEAALSPSLPATTWYAVGSTQTVNANVNAPNVIVNGSYLPVYNTQGIAVWAGGASSLYSGPLLAPVLYDQFGGSMHSEQLTWTGSLLGGTASPNYLGSTAGDNHDITEGLSDDPARWLAANGDPSVVPRSMYALSGVIPEPSSLILLAIGGLGLGALWIVRMSGQCA